jgi:protein ImuB
MFACIYLPNFPIAAVLRAEPELHAQAVAVVEGKPPLEKIIAVSQKAAHMGIDPGMTKAQAELCSELTLRTRSSLQELAAHAALLDCAQSFSPLVEDSASDTALLDLAGMESLLGTLPEIARAIQERAASLGLEANVAVATNPDAALIAARGFSGVTVISCGKEAGRLGSLLLNVLFAEAPNNDKENREQKEEGDRLLETLERWGVRDLKTLAALPEIALSERLGQTGLHLQQLARGAASRTLVPVEAPLVFEEGMELEHPIVLLEPLAFLLNRLLEQICARLGSRALATQELRLTLDLDNQPGLDQEFENFGIPSESDASSDEMGSRAEAPAAHSLRKRQFCRTLQLPLPMLDAKLFLKLLHLDLNAHPPCAPIVKVHLVAKPARPRAAQGGLFVPLAPEPEKLELTLARIANIVGEDRVGAVELLDTHRPEGFRMRHFTAQPAPKNLRGKKSEPVEETATEEKSPLTALRRFRPALHATITLDAGSPVHVVCAKKKEVEGNVLWKAGPWRSSGDWWEREAWARDEWDIALQQRESIALYRLVHDLLGGGWFIEGMYD